MKASKAFLLVGLFVLVASMSLSQAAEESLAWAPAEKGTYEPGYGYAPAPLETKRYEAYENVRLSLY